MKNYDGIHELGKTVEEYFKNESQLLSELKKHGGLLQWPSRLTPIPAGWENFCTICIINTDSYQPNIGCIDKKIVKISRDGKLLSTISL